MAGEIVTKSKRFYCVSIFPDICLTPIGPTMVPIPYMIVGEFSEATGVSPNIRSNGEPVVIHSSTVIPKVYGDEAGIGKGIKSKTVGARVQHMEKSSSLSFNGERAIRVGDLVYMNDKNTIGMVFERRSSLPPTAPAKDGEPSTAALALAKLKRDPGAALVGNESAATKALAYIPHAILNLVPGDALLSPSLSAVTGSADSTQVSHGTTPVEDWVDGQPSIVGKLGGANARASRATIGRDGGVSRGRLNSSSIHRGGSRTVPPASSMGQALKLSNRNGSANGSDTTIATSRQNFRAIAAGAEELHPAQAKVLAELKGFGSRTTTSKRAFGQKDLVALSAATGDEFALFTRGSRRLIVRGDANGVPIGILDGSAQKLANDGWRWSSHVHPDGSLMSSIGDRNVLGVFGHNARSAVCDPFGGRALFNPSGDLIGPSWLPPIS